MKSRWDDSLAPVHDELLRRTYSSQLIGRDQRLVLHGGGNTSLKWPYDDRFGESVPALWVKASGFDLATMGSEGFTGLDHAATVRLAELDDLSDADMVTELLRARLDPVAATPSIEAIAHGLIPFRYVDHTHADAVVTVSNLPDGSERLREIYGERVLVLPYVKPGFDLARQLAAVADDLGSYEGVVLEHHGLFTYAHDARASYEATIDLVDEAERHLEEEFGAPSTGDVVDDRDLDAVTVARSRRQASEIAERPLVSLPAGAVEPDLVGAVAALLDAGPLTPEHVIHNKPFPAILGGDVDADLRTFVAKYQDYFDRGTDSTLTMLRPHPHWAIFESGPVRSFGPTAARARISADVASTTLRAMSFAHRAGGWSGLSEEALRDLEYWDLEQAKLRRQPPPPPLTGKIAVVTGAASGIGRACAELLADEGAVVVAVDIDESVTELDDRPAIDGHVADVTDEATIARLLAGTVDSYGGIDHLVSTVGIFRTGQPVEELDDGTWEESLRVNLTSHRTLVANSVPFLREGIDPSVVFVGSRNVAAPGAGAAAYSVSKAGLTQLMRVLALELATDGIRVNAVHPDAVFDTALWTDEALETSARRYGLTVDEYKTRNLLSTEVTSSDVAKAVVALVDGTLAKTTGSQVPVDGGNDRVI